MDNQVELIEHLRNTLSLLEQLIKDHKRIITKLTVNETNIIDHLRIAHKQVSDDGEQLKKEQRILLQNQLKNVRDQLGIGKKKC